MMKSPTYWGLTAVLIALWIAMLFVGTGPVDRDVLMALYAADEPFIALAAIGFTHLGSWYAVVVATLIGATWLAYRGKRLNALILLIASFTGRGLVIVTKEWFARVRPEEHLRLVEVHYQSFPSGHSANSLIAYVGFAILAFEGRARTLALAIALLVVFCIGISRPMLGVHWPTDVIGGWAFGGFWLMLVLAGGDYYKHLKGVPKR